MNLLENEDKSGLSRPLLSYDFSFFYYLELSIYKKSENGLLVVKANPYTVIPLI